MLAGFNAQYLCTTTFAITPETATLVVKSGTTILTANLDGTYSLKEGSYTYSITATGYTPIVNAALTITNAEETTGTKTVTVVMTTCVVTFATTPADATVVVKSGETVVTANQDGTYNLIAGTYSYTVSKEDYTPLTDEELIISAGDITELKLLR